MYVYICVVVAVCMYVCVLHIKPVYYSSISPVSVLTLHNNREKPSSVVTNY